MMSLFGRILLNGVASDVCMYNVHELIEMHLHTHTHMYRSLRHPNLVCLIGVSLDEMPVYLVTEFMAKGSLVEYLRSRGRAIISKQNLLDFAKHICKAMVYLESKSFVHR